MRLGLHVMRTLDLADEPPEPPLAHLDPAVAQEFAALRLEVVALRAIVGQCVTKLEGLEAARAAAAPAAEEG